VASDAIIITINAGSFAGRWGQGREYFMERLMRAGMNLKKTKGIDVPYGTF
jgi:hypothetical protein